MEHEGKTEEHRFLQRTKQEPKIAEVKRIAAYILNHYTNNEWSPKQYENKGLMILSWKEKEEAKQLPLRFDNIVAHIQGDRTFDSWPFRSSTASRQLAGFRSRSRQT